MSNPPPLEMGLDHRRNIKILIGLWLAGLTLSGCVARPMIMDQTPWHLMSSGVYDTAQGRAFYGIGKAEGSQNVTLLRATAVNSARKELARVLDGYIAELFHATRTMPALTMEEGEQMIGALVRNAMKLSVISDQWQEPEKGRLYALCRLDLDRFKQVLATQTAIDPEVRAAMAAEAENVHDRLMQPTR